MIKKIVSGGQAGVDQAALEAAVGNNIAVGGWCTIGEVEGGDDIAEKYSLQEFKNLSPNEKTKLNIRFSDGTLVIVPSWPMPEQIKDGTILTIATVTTLNRPCLIIDLSDKRDDVNKMVTWIKDNNIKILNIAGPREVSSPGIHDLAYKLLNKCFADLS